jgi:hypothetical protein
MKMRPVKKIPLALALAIPVQILLAAEHAIAWKPCAQKRFYYPPG